MTRSYDRASQTVAVVRGAERDRPEVRIGRSLAVDVVNLRRGFLHAHDDARDATDLADVVHPPLFSRVGIAAFHYLSP